MKIIFTFNSVSLRDNNYYDSRWFDMSHLKQGADVVRISDHDFDADAFIVSDNIVADIVNQYSSYGVSGMLNLSNDRLTKTHIYRALNYALSSDNVFDVNTFDLPKKCTIVTSASNFYYHIDGNTCTYDGAYNGFLEQQLLPYFTGVKITDVYNSKGDYFPTIDDYKATRID